VGEDEDDFGTQGRIVRRKVEKVRERISKGETVLEPVAWRSFELTLKSLQGSTSISAVRSRLSVYLVEAMLHPDP
jgi:predicted DNA-binding protein (UPF0278 family)